MKVMLVSFSLLWAQNVGIGTTLPSARLHVVNQAALATVLQANNSSDQPILVGMENGRVGIATASPLEVLHIEGNFQLEGDFRPSGNPGNVGDILFSQGTNASPVWRSVGWKCYAVETWTSGGGTNGWSGASVTTCSADQVLLGGYGQCGAGCNLSKTFTNLPPHTEVMVEVAWWAIDSWDQANNIGVDRIQLSLDGVVVAVGVPTIFATSSLDLVSSNVSHCGVTTWIDRGPFWLTGRMAHTGSSLSVSVQNLADQGSTDESLGVSMVRIWLR
ncbi:MAG: hypothetical protein ABDH66_00185 [Bacteroidia bacterium]